MNILNNIQRLDLLAFNWCFQRRYLNLFTSLSRLLSKTADGHLYLLVGITFVYFNEIQLFTIIMVLFTFERLSYFILKNRFRRNRPPQAIPGFRSIIQPSDQFSFPSGHTSAAFLFSGIITSAYPPLGLVLYPWACLVGSSRVFLGVHFPSDIAAGALLGFSFSLLAYSHNGF